jgi:anti-sigma factor ChrR (cupin superfamily)
MAYRGKRYFIAQDGPDSWKWTVELNESTHQSGVAKSRETALTSIVLMIDRTMRQTRRKPPAWREQ